MSQIFGKYCAIIIQNLVLRSRSVVWLTLELILKLRKTETLKVLQLNHSHKSFGRATDEFGHFKKLVPIS